MIHWINSSSPFATSVNSHIHILMNDLLFIADHHLGEKCFLITSNDTYAYISSKLGD